ncbi:8986_t:CDS:2 [Dentiscutata erythropus]|uniref:8986_t:CDS:1 n=1 Tax=Dentiscutata erythropus TaxID=1348616 RepID=A0A9N8Z0U6_9GLOM|nr:8986_t:CDS:2 [Dentiscutata erythropus]
MSDVINEATAAKYDNGDDEIDSVKNKKMVFKWDLKSAENKNLPESYKSLEAMCIVWKKKVELFKAQINVAEYKNGMVKISLCNVLNNTKVNKKYNLNSNGLREMCITWMDKAVHIQGLKKHTSEIIDNRGMVKCKNSVNILSFSNNKMEKLRLKG